MLKSLKEIEGFKILARDSGQDTFGKIKDIYFDKKKWAVRYIVVETGSWLLEQKVLISPYSIMDVNWDESIIMLDLSKHQIKESPKAEFKRPVSRKYEVLYNNYYKLPHYWSNGFGLDVDGFWAGNNLPMVMDHLSETLSATHLEAEIEAENNTDQNLFSMNDVVSSFTITSSENKRIGKIENLIFDETSWAIRYLVIDVGHFWETHKKILLSTEWIEKFNWDAMEFKSEISSALIPEGPEYLPEKELDRVLEIEIFSYYNQPAYWSPHRKMNFFEDEVYRQNP